MNHIWYLSNIYQYHEIKYVLLLYNTYEDTFYESGRQGYRNTIFVKFSADKRLQNNNEVEMTLKNRPEIAAKSCHRIIFDIDSIYIIANN